MTKVDLPLPETPVIPIIKPKGKSTVIFLRLLPVQPDRVNLVPLPVLLLTGIFICRVLLRYFEVKVSSFNILFGVPCEMISPPFLPAKGPISIRWSARSIISLSCSTTSTEFPKSFKAIRELINLSLSL